MTQQQIDQHALFAQVCEALDKVAYGEIVIKVEQHQPVWLELHEKIRIVTGGRDGQRKNVGLG